MMRIRMADSEIVSCCPGSKTFPIKTNRKVKNLKRTGFGASAA
jgi:hypothetical protein